jgi:hypothetical protein
MKCWHLTVEDRDNRRIILNSERHTEKDGSITLNSVDSNVILPSLSLFSKWPFSMTFPNQHFVHIPRNFIVLYK